MAGVVRDRVRVVPRVGGLDDSKALSAARREILAALIRERARDWALGAASVEEIDRLNILQATLLAMRRAVEALAVRPEAVWVDGNRAPAVAAPVRCIVGGDRTEAAIMAASILAKTARDAQMRALDTLHPQYGFAQHKGYPTATHIAALRAHGVLAVHRRSFAPVRDILTGSN